MYQQVSIVTVVTMGYRRKIEDGLLIRATSEAESPLALLFHAFSLRTGTHSEILDTHAEN